jgi:hypothetical protein
MARQLRVEYPGAIYHVTVRSNGKENLFKTDGIVNIYWRVWRRPRSAAACEFTCSA